MVEIGLKMVSRGVARRVIGESLKRRRNVVGKPPESCRAVQAAQVEGLLAPRLDTWWHIRGPRQRRRLRLRRGSKFRFGLARG